MIVCRNNVVTVFEKSNVNSRRLTQALYGDWLYIEDGQSNDSKMYRVTVKNPVTLQDVVSGFALKSHIQSFNGSFNKDNFTHIVYSLIAPLYDASVSEVQKQVGTLSFGTYIRATNLVGGMMGIIRPDGQTEYRISPAHIIPISEAQSGLKYIQTFKNMAMRFVGVPFLRGGVSSYGLDCSGLISLVCRFMGINLPRFVNEIRTSELVTTYELPDSYNEITDCSLITWVDPNPHIGLVVYNNNRTTQEVLHSNLHLGRVTLTNIRNLSLNQESIRFHKINVLQ